MTQAAAPPGGRELLAVDAEAAVVGAVLDNPSLLPMARLKPDDFTSPTLRGVWQAILDMDKLGLSPDVITIRPKLVEAGVRISPLQLTRLTSKYPCAANLERYALIVKDAAAKRRLVSMMDRVMLDSASKPASEIRALLGDALKDDSSDLGAPNIGTLKDALAEWDNSKATAGHPTGIKDLDAAMNGGYHPGGITLIGGESGCGKTVLVLQSLRRAIALDTHAFVVSRDQLFAQIAGRIWSAESGVQRGELAASEDAQEVRRMLEGWPLYYHKGSYDLSNVTSGIRIACAQYGVRMWALDYLQRITVDGRRDRSGEVAVEVANALADVAQDTNSYGLVISRVTKPSMGMQRIHRFAGEAGVVNAADCVLFVEKADPENMVDDGSREIWVTGKRWAGDSVVLAYMEGALDRYRDADEMEKCLWKQKRRER